MFNKNNTYLIPQASSSSLRAPFDVNGVEILLHHQDVFNSGGHYLAGNAPIIIGGNLNSSELQNDAVPRKQSAKKDRHSKIYTAQGPRDRRVRLSIGIARKFFDLQETLGFDKPSKTLDWLFTKSKAAIKDLLQKTSAGPSSPSECDLISSENGDDSNKRTASGRASFLAKESRAKARARARERTREKMCIKHLNGPTNINGFDSYNVPCSLPNEAHNLIQLKRKTKSPSFFGFQQNGDLSSNYIIPSPNPNEINWDVCNFTSQSNLYAILDHHKFINQ